MNPVLLKSLVGVGVLGTTAAASVGGYYWLSSSDPKTIGEKITGKIPLKPYNANDAQNKASWTAKKDSYAQDSTVAEDILGKANVDEDKLSKKCEEILKTSLNPKPADLDKKMKWAEKWCFMS